MAEQTYEELKGIVESVNSGERPQNALYHDAIQSLESMGVTIKKGPFGLIWSGAPAETPTPGTGPGTGPGTDPGPTPPPSTPPGDGPFIPRPQPSPGDGPGDGTGTDTGGIDYDNIPNPGGHGGIFDADWASKYLTTDEQAVLAPGQNTGIMTPAQLMKRAKVIYGSKNTHLKDWFTGWHMNQAAGAKDREAYLTYSYGNDTLGRELTADEFNEALTFFQGPGGENSGREYINELKKNESDIGGGDGDRTGEQQDQWDAYAEDVKGIFTDLLGRPPEENELNYYVDQLSAGRDPFELEGAIKNTTEYTDIQDEEFRTGLGGDYDEIGQAAFDKYSPQITSKFTQQGIRQSPALAQAFADMSTDIETRKTEALAGLKVSQYGGSQDYAKASYQADLNQWLQGQAYGGAQNDAYMNALRSRAWNASDVGLMSQMGQGGMGYMDGGQQQFPWGQTAGTMIGAGVGSIWGPGGAMAGGMIGGAGGRMVDSFSSY